MAIPLKTSSETIRSVLCVGAGLGGIGAVDVVSGVDKDDFFC